ncbi:hypothetical protein LCGC14_2538540, partial [marine sediment metagenome]
MEADFRRSRPFTAPVPPATLGQLLLRGFRFGFGLLGLIDRRLEIALQGPIAHVVREL